MRRHRLLLAKSQKGQKSEAASEKKSGDVVVQKDPLFSAERRATRESRESCIFLSRLPRLPRLSLPNFTQRRARVEKGDLKACKERLGERGFGAHWPCLAVVYWSISRVLPAEATRFGGHFSSFLAFFWLRTSGPGKRPCRLPCWPIRMLGTGVVKKSTENTSIRQLLKPTK